MLLYIAINYFIFVSALIETYATKQLNDLFYIGRQRQIINYFVLAILALVSGTRLLGGSDYYFYKQAYQNVPTVYDVIKNKSLISQNFWLAGMDVGYLLITASIKTIGFNFHGYCMIQSLFFYFSFYKGIRRYCNNFSIVLLVFIAKLFFYDTFVSMRQSITIAIFFLSLSLIEEKKYIKYFFVCAICSFIHAGAVILFPVYFVNFLRLNKKKYVAIILVFLPFAILNFLRINIIGIFVPLFTKVFGFFSNYWVNKTVLYTAGEGSGMSPLYIFEFLLIAFLVLYNLDAILENKKSEFALKLFLCAWPLYTLFGGISVITREKDYFIIFYGVVICYCSYLSTRKYRWLILLLTSAICIFEFWRYVVLFDHASLMNYSSWLL